MTYRGYRSPLLLVDRGERFRQFCKVAGPLLVLIGVFSAARDIFRSGQPVTLEWQQFTCTEGRFRVNMPGKPRLAEKNMETEAGNVLVRSYIVWADEKAFSVSYLDLPLALMIDDPGAELDRQIDAKGTPGSFMIVRKDRQSIFGYPALRYSFKFTANHRGIPEGTVTEGLLVLADRRHYELVVAFPSGIPTDAGEEFLKSFRIVAR